MSETAFTKYVLSHEQGRYISSGFKCPKCTVRVLPTSLKYYTRNGRPLSIVEKSLRLIYTYGWILPVFDTSECPRCGYRWKSRGIAPAAAPPSPATINTIETNRTEEFYGEDRRIIDNSRSSATPTRSFSFSKEWSRTFDIGLEKATADGTALTIGEKDVAALRLSSETKLRQTYSVSDNTKETSSEEVSCEIPARCKLTVVVRWKRIWQEGFIIWAKGGSSVNIPFRVAVGVTFDQELIQEGGESSAEP